MSKISKRLRDMSSESGEVRWEFLLESAKEIESLEAGKIMLNNSARDLLVKNKNLFNSLGHIKQLNDGLEADNKLLKAKVKDLMLDVDSYKVMIKIILEEKDELIAKLLEATDS